MDSTQDTRNHINKVQVRIAEFQAYLDTRAALHDASKLVEPEKSGYDLLTSRLADVVYGSAEYRAALDEGRETVAHHYAHNSHHPEHWPVPTGNAINILREDIAVLREVQRSIQGDIESEGPLDEVSAAAYDALVASIARNIARLEHDLSILESRMNGMSLLDLVEMLCDHKAASERTKQGSIEQSLDINRSRFGYSDQLYSILRNTIRELGW